MSAAVASTHFFKRLMTLKELRIQNIVLIESAILTFVSGFNVLSGETGSGKSAVMDTLSLISGERADAALIRRGAEKGCVEALFDCEAVPSVAKLLEDAGIDHEAGEPLIIRREIAASGKGRAFINNQSVQLVLLRKVCDLLFDQIGQHASRLLLTTEQHRALLDLFGGLESDMKAFKDSWEKENLINRKLEQLVNSAAQRIREVEVCQREIEELEEASLKEGEEEELFAEYTRLSAADELAGHIESLVQLLTHEQKGVLPSLSRSRASVDKIAAIDSFFTEPAASYHNALTELQEVAYTLEKGLSRCESQPERTAEINDRLTLINKLKRKYGATIAEMQAYLKQIRQKLSELENSDEEIDALKVQQKDLQEKNQTLAASLSEKRRKASLAFSKQLTPLLRSLNMPKAEFEIDVTKQPRSASGDDKVEFFLLPNVGEKRLAIKDFASGGELSRLMLALQTLLAGKQQLPTLVFDEIDANIGGTTAAVVGETLRNLGKHHQVIAITHFPQVAQYADNHLQIAKREHKGRTLTEITPLLDKKLREQELARMSGSTV